MGVAGHQDVDAGDRPFDGRALEIDQGGPQLSGGRAQPQPHVGDDLVVARAARMQFAGDLGADQLAQASFVGGVDIFIAGLDWEGARGPFGAHGLQPLDQTVALGGRDQPRLIDRPGPGDGAGDVGVPQPLVEPDRMGEARGQRILSLAESPAP